MDDITDSKNGLELDKAAQTCAAVGPVCDDQSGNGPIYETTARTIHKSSYRGYRKYSQEYNHNTFVLKETAKGEKCKNSNSTKKK